jgi:hypothetical protein
VLIGTKGLYDINPQSNVYILSREPFERPRDQVCNHRGSWEMVIWDQLIELLFLVQNVPNLSYHS